MAATMEHPTIAAARTAVAHTREARERTRDAKTTLVQLLHRARQLEAGTAAAESRLAETLRDVAATANALGRATDVELLLRESSAAEKGAQRARNASDR